MFRLLAKIDRIFPRAVSKKGCHVPTEFIKAQGDWKSDAYLVYLTLSSSKKLALLHAIATEFINNVAIFILINYYYSLQVFGFGVLISGSLAFFCLIKIQKSLPHSIFKTCL